jgi:enoyl-CoA hydratase
MLLKMDDHDGIAVIRMQHGKANVLDLELCRALAATLDTQRTTPARALVLTGEGSIFSAGVDLKRVLDGGSPYVATFLPALRDVFDVLFAFPKPVVAAVNGHAIAGGCVIVCAADHRVMARGTGRIGIPELLVGVPFPTIALEIMRGVARPHELPTLVYGGGTFEPEAALARGLVDVLVDGPRLLDAAIAEAKRLAALPPAAFALTKRQLRAPALARVAGEGREHDIAVQRLWEAPDTHARIRTYAERTLKSAR